MQNEIVLARYPRTKPLKWGTVQLGAYPSDAGGKIGLTFINLSGKTEASFFPVSFNPILTGYGAMHLLAQIRSQGLNETHLLAAWLHKILPYDFLRSFYPELHLCLVKKSGGMARFRECELHMPKISWVESDMTKMLKKLWRAGIRCDGRELFDRRVEHSNQEANELPIRLIMEMVEPSGEPRPVKTQAESLGEFLKTIGVTKIIPHCLYNSQAASDEGPFTVSVTEIDQRVQAQALDLNFPGYQLTEFCSRVSPIRRQIGDKCLTLLSARWIGSKFLVLVTIQPSLDNPLNLIIGEFPVESLRDF